MQYVVDPAADEPIILLDDYIGTDPDEPAPGIQGNIFQRELLALDSMGKSRIQVWINSPGGSVSDGYAIYNAILNSKTKVDTYCMGMAASSAGWIFQAGRRRIMADYGILMYHNPFDADGSGADKMLAATQASIITMIASRCGMSEKEVADMMDRTSFILADEALELGLCDQVQDSGQLNKKRLSTATVNMSEHLQWSRRILNRIKGKASEKKIGSVIGRTMANKMGKLKEEAPVEKIGSIIASTMSNKLARIKATEVQ